MEEISICCFEDISKVKSFIDNSWSKNHILSNNQQLLDFQHKAKKNYNFVISKNSLNQVTAILGFIPTFQFDDDLDNYGDIWLAIWKVDEALAQPGIGFALLKWLEKEMAPKSIGAIGINNDVKQIYEVLGYKTGVLKHYYFLNPFITEFIISNPSPSLLRNTSNDSFSVLKEISVDEIRNLQFLHSPFKSFDYIFNRYSMHPFFNYIILGCHHNQRLNAVFIIRKVNVFNSSCLRIVDIIGDYSRIGNIAPSLIDLLQKYNSEYIDCLNHGLPENLFNDWGFILRNHNSIIPNYFEPFLKKNVDILFAYKTVNSEYIIFKGDSDQDRPSIIQ
jgi:hypothetical protein